jgi:DNA-binding MarR family transcriptional regulator
MTKLESLLDDRSRDPELLAWYRFVRVMSKIISTMDKSIRDANVSRYQFDVLIQIAHEDGINQQTCADRLNVTKGNITQHLNRLEEQELVWRQKEGRINYLHLTKAGKELLASIIPGHDQWVKEILSLLSPDELNQFKSIFRKLDRGLDSK